MAILLFARCVLQDIRQNSPVHLIDNVPPWISHGEPYMSLTEGKVDCHWLRVLH